MGPTPVDALDAARMGLFVFGLMVILAALAVYNLQVGVCPECPHCRNERAERKRRRIEANASRFPAPHDKEKH